METDTFGLYELAGKATLFAGPLLLGLATYLFRSQRADVDDPRFLCRGLVILLPLPEPHRQGGSSQGAS